MILEDDTYPELILSIPQYQYNVKILFYLFGVFTFVAILREQVPEIRVLQLVPGLYLLYLFCAFAFLLSCSNWMYRYFLYSDVPSYQNGIQSKLKWERKITIKLNFFFFLLILGFGLTLVVPISLESFRTSEKQTIDGSWSYGQVLWLENFLTFVLSVLSQLPIFFLSNFFNEEEIETIPKLWRKISFLVLVGAGFLTPTVDIASQLSFAISIMCLYFLVLELNMKRPLIKGNVFSIFTS